MDCKTARKVWNHPKGLMAGLDAQQPGFMQHLDSLVDAFVRSTPDPFDRAVKMKAGGGRYRVTHADDVSPLGRFQHDVLGDEVARRELEKHFGVKYGVPDLRLAAVCCGGCKISDGDLGDEHNLAIQMAAVNTNPDGSSVS